MSTVSKTWLASVTALVLSASMVRAAGGREWAPGELLLRLSPRAAKSLGSDPSLERLHRRYGVVAVEPLFPAGRQGAKTAGGSAIDGWVRLTVDSGLDPRLIAADYAELDAVEWAQPNYLRRFASLPNDSLVSRQWNLADIGWDPVALEGEGTVIVAVVDSGLDFYHPDIAGQVWQNRPELEGMAGIDDDGNGYVDDTQGWDFTDAPGLPGEGDYLERDADPADESGHGTHVAGIIAAVAGNGTGIAGVAPKARLMVLRAGFNLPGGGYLEDDDLAAAIVYAADNGARVINMSWGDPFFSPLIKDVVRYADQAGCVLVAAAGNEGDNQVFYPARLDETIAVTASTPQGMIAAFANWGASLDLAAPGQGILSLVPGGGYGERSGTSMAAAHVSGMAALVLARYPDLTPRQVHGALALNARDLGSPGWDIRSGAGMAQVAVVALDPPAALQIAAPGTGSVLAEGSTSVRVEMTGLDTWEVSWSAGGQMPYWHSLARGADREETVEALWDKRGLDAGTYLLRARGSSQGRELEDWVEVRLERSGPVVRTARLFRALEGARWVYLVEWQTDIPAGGWVRLKVEGETVMELPAVPGRSAQRLILPGELVPGSYAVEIEPESGTVRGPVLEIGTLDADSEIGAWRLDSIARLPDGYLMPQIVDIDGDGRAEVGQMPYDGLQYNTGEFYHLRDGALRRAHSSPLLFIPWNVHDLDGDGWKEVMAVDARRVRLLEARQRGEFPDRVIWEREGVWGGETGDLDGDGRPEMFLRSDQNSLFQVFESTGDDRFAQIAVLDNTGGTNTGEPGTRQVAADLDGDGRGELLAGYGNGDLIVFESIANDAFRISWQAIETRPHVDARVLGGGADLDGDGRVEFIVARLLQEPYQLQETRWVVEVYQASGDNAFVPEWQVEVLGGTGGGNGIAVADLDGDGGLEFALALVPDLHLFRAVGPDEYSPVWHASIVRTFRPAAGDLDGDGREELAFDTAQGVEVFSQAAAPGGAMVPAGFSAYPLDGSRVLLEWKPVPGAGGYRLYRDDVVIASGLTGTRFEDGDLEPGRLYRYSVAILDASTGLPGPRTADRSVRPEPAPRVLSVQRLSSSQLSVLFSAPMALPYREPFRFRVEPGARYPSSLLSDRGGIRAFLTFSEDLPDTGSFQLEIGPLRSLHGVPLAVRRFDFTLQPASEPSRPLAAEALAPTRVAVRFSRNVVAPADPGAVFSFTPPEIRVEQSRAEGNRIVLELAAATPLRPLGRRYEVHIEGLEDEAGNRIRGSLSLRFAAATLDGVRVFPNPFFPARGLLTFGYLTPEATIRIYDAGGQLLRTLAEWDADGGVQWDGLNGAGRPVDSGVYFFQVVGVGERAIGKFALVRE